MTQTNKIVRTPTKATGGVTPEELEKMKVHSNMWIKHIMRTETADYEKLRAALHQIGYDYVELSYDKVNYFYLEHMMIARNAYQNSFSEEQPTKQKPLCDNF
jgi:hypothetical protein